MFRKRVSENIQDNIKEEINGEYNVVLRKKQERQRRLDTDTYKSYELDKVVEEHLSKLEDISLNDLEIDSVWLGIIGIYYYPIGKNMQEQVYSRRELEYMQKQFKKLGFKTQISNSQVGFTPYIYLRLVWYR